jgi:predicted HAD superfamily Cof-like phosphohydrolase
MGQPTTTITEVTTFATKTEWVTDIAEMHTKFGVNPVIRNLDKEKLSTFLKFRLDFLKEELVEAYEAAGYKVTFDAVRTGEPLDPSRAEDVVDAAIDLCVVAIGTLDAFEVDADMAWARVHDKNMQKEPGIKPARPNPLGLPDLIKPAGWTAPTHADNVGLLSKVFE